MKEICELLNELDAGREKFFIDRRTKVNGVITLHTPQVCRTNLSSSHKVKGKF
jgi:hypothetical protein